MALPKGFIDSLGGDAGADDSAPDDTASDSMLEQHLSAMFRAGQKGDFATAGDCFRAALAAADEPEAGDESDTEEY